IGVVAITVLLIIVLRRPYEVAMVVAPLLLAALLTLAVTVVIGMPLNYANIIALPLLLGIGVAFDIYFVMNWRAGLTYHLQSSTAREPGIHEHRGGTEKAPNAGAWTSWSVFLDSGLAATRRPGMTNRGY